MLSKELPEAGATTASYAPKFFNAHRMETIIALAELIIPSDGHSSEAKAARVHEFIDTPVAGSSEDRKRLWVDGLKAVDH